MASGQLLRYISSYDETVPAFGEASGAMPRVAVPFSDCVENAHEHSEKDSNTDTADINSFLIDDIFCPLPKQIEYTVSITDNPAICHKKYTDRI